MREREGPAAKQWEGEGSSAQRENRPPCERYRGGYHRAVEKGRIIQTARRLRRDMTDAERKIWALLRQPPFLEHRFRRQIPFDRYVADFASHSLRLIVEIDGSQHLEADAAEIARTRYLKSRGYRLLRFWNRDVLLNTEGMAETILRNLGAGPPHPPG